VDIKSHQAKEPRRGEGVEIEIGYFDDLVNVTTKSGNLSINRNNIMKDAVPVRKGVGGFPMYLSISANIRKLLS